MAYTACAMPTCFVNMSDTRSVPEQDAYDYVSYVVSTGKDYDSGQQTKDSLETRREFIEQFPEYAAFSFWRLQFIGESEKQLITDWFFQDWDKRKVIPKF